MKILIIAEHDNSSFKSVNTHILTAAQIFSGDTDLLLAGQISDDVLASAACLPYISRILHASNAVYNHHMPENYCELIASLIRDQKYDTVLMPATTFGKNILPRVAALLDVSMISDVVGIESADTFVRPIFAGNAQASVKISEKIRLLTIRGTAFPEMKEKAEKSAQVVAVETVFENTLAHFVKLEQQVSERPELTAAKIVVSGGRGLKNAENFKMLEAFADSIGAAVGASRAAVDAGFAPNDWQVGQTGKIVAPDLYIAVGISGAIQHLAGMKDSKIIVAINSDPEAPIFQVADYALVGDLFQILPELQDAWSCS